MRRSMAPSIKRLKVATAENKENQPPGADISRKASTHSTVSLGGHFSLPINISGVTGPDNNTQQCISTQCISTQRLNQHRAVQQQPMQQFKCPLPYGQSSGGSRGSLGAKKAYGGGLDLLAAIQRQVVLADPRQDHAGPSNAVSELVLYDPEEHKLQWLAQQEAADPASQLEPTTASDPQPPTAPSLPTTASTPSTAAAAPKDDMAWEKRVKVYADPFLVERLRPHQREGVKFVFECLSGVRQQGISGAVLADGMGLGKTFQTIASLYCLLTKGIFGHPTCKKPLILCPTSLVQNWGKELVKWLGDRVEPVVVDDTKADKVKKSLQDFRGFSRTGKARVLVMSYPCFRGHKAEVYKLGIDVLMCDEAHFLKNGEAQITQAVSGLPTQRRLLMSGTPIQNDLSEFHAVFDLACPGLLGNLNTFRKVHEGPIQRGRDADATEKQVELGRVRMNDLMKLCNRFMLRRTSTVLKELLPTKVEQVVFCKLSKLQLKLYEHFLASRPVKALLASTQDEDGRPRKRKPSKAAGTQAAGGQQQQQEARPEGQEEEDEQEQQLLAPLAAITALKKLCCHPDLIWDMLHKHKATELKAAQMQQLAALREAQRRVSARASAQAPKSYIRPTGSDSDEDAGDKGKDMNKRASKRAAGSSSGSARQQLSGFEGCTHLFSDGDVYPSYQQGRCQAFHSGKVMVLEALLKSIIASEPGDKVVLVSNYTEALDVLGVMCKSHNWVSLRLDGSCSVKQRQALVDTFNDPQHPSFVLLLSSKAGGVGLNIIGANRLVLFDPDWNPANDLQAMARVWREGQAKRVWIYRLLMAGSIEEKVLQRQLAKQGLSEALVDEVGQEVRTFSRDELRSLFKVDPSTPCDTHCAIKCTCNGSVAAMAGCRERAAALGGGSSSDGADAAEQQGILAWAHLARASDSPDPTWGTMSSWVRDNFVTYLFSDHVLGEQGPPGASARLKAAGASSKATAGTAAGKRHASGTSSSSSGSDADQSSAAEESEEEDAVPAAGCSGHSSKQRSARGLASSLKATAASALALPASSHKATGVVSTSKASAKGPAVTGTPPLSAAAAVVSEGGTTSPIVPPARAADAATSSSPSAGAAKSRHSTAALPPKPKRAPTATVAATAAAGTAGTAKHPAPAAARRRSAAAVLTHSQAPPAGAEAAAAPSAGKATGNARAASRRRNSAPACNASSTSGQAGRRRGPASKQAGKNDAGAAGSKSAAAPVPDLSVFAYSGATTTTKAGGRACAGTAAGGVRGSMLAAGAAGGGAAGSSSAVTAAGGADSSAGGGGADSSSRGAPSPPQYALVPGQLDDLVSELCPQLSDPLDDTPMGLDNDSDSNFM